MMDRQTQQAQTKPTFNLTKKLVLGMVGVSVVTYGTSAFFIFNFSSFFTRYIPGWAYTVIILFLGVLWSGILGYLRLPLTENSPLILVLLVTRLKEKNNYLKVLSQKSRRTSF
jgi:hypothetical protein